MPSRLEIDEMLDSAKKLIASIRGNVTGKDYTEVAKALKGGGRIVKTYARTELNEVPRGDHVLHVATLGNTKMQTNIFIDVKDKNLYVIE